MRADSAIHPPLSRVSIKSIEIPRVAVATKPVPVELFATRWHRAPRVDGMVALAELGRQTGARC